jgi:hypothetical protein
MKFSDGLFLETARRVAEDFPDIAFDDRIIDAVCMQLIQAPERFDVLVLPNMYGDLVAELGAGLIGGTGVAPGAPSAADGRELAVFEATRDRHPPRGHEPWIDRADPVGGDAAASRPGRGGRPAGCSGRVVLARGVGDHDLRASAIVPPPARSRCGRHHHAAVAAGTDGMPRPLGARWVR